MRARFRWMSAALLILAVANLAMDHTVLGLALIASATATWQLSR